jgi:molecular chaperone GrpE
VPAAEKDAGEKGAQEPPAAEMDNRKVIEELREQIRRMQADFENFKRRMEQSREDMRACAREDVLKSLLPVIDNLEWALHSTKQSKNFDAFFEGITLVARSFKELLTREGLVEITAAGERFDPSRHQAIAMEEREDMPDETVVEEFQKGYQLGTKVIRPSLVKVARVPHKEEAKSDE